MTPSPAIDRIRRRTGEGGVGYHLGRALVRHPGRRRSDRHGARSAVAVSEHGTHGHAHVRLGGASVRPPGERLRRPCRRDRRGGRMPLPHRHGRSCRPHPWRGCRSGTCSRAALSVALTMLILQLLKLPHAPAGATTMIISLGVIATPLGILSMAGALAFTILAAFGVSWLLWRPRQPWKPEEKDAPQPMPDPAQGAAPAEGAAAPVRRRDIRRS